MDAHRLGGEPRGAQRPAAVAVLRGVRRERPRERGAAARARAARERRRRRRLRRGRLARRAGDAACARRCGIGGASQLPQAPYTHKEARGNSAWRGGRLRRIPGPDLLAREGLRFIPDAARRSRRKRLRCRREVAPSVAASEWSSAASTTSVRIGALGEEAIARFRHSTPPGEAGPPWTPRT